MTETFAEATLEPAPLIVPQGHVAPALSVVVPDQDQLVDDAIARAVALGSDVDDDIDAIDVIDPDLFPIFEEEASELLPQLGGALRQWASRPDNLGARSEVLRALHTLKGSSRLAGAMRLGEMAHRLESAIEHLDAETVTTDQIEPLQGSFDGLQANLMPCERSARPVRTRGVAACGASRRALPQRHRQTQALRQQYSRACRCSCGYR